MKEEELKDGKKEVRRGENRKSDGGRKRQPGRGEEEGSNGMMKEGRLEQWMEVQRKEGTQGETERQKVRKELEIECKVRKK